MRIETDIWTSLIVTFVSSQPVKADVRSGIGRNEIPQEVIKGTPRIFSYYGRSIALSEGSISAICEQDKQ